LVHSSAPSPNRVWFLCGTHGNNCELIMDSQQRVRCIRFSEICVAIGLLTLEVAAAAAAAPTRRWLGAGRFRCHSSTAARAAIDGRIELVGHHVLV